MPARRPPPGVLDIDTPFKDLLYTNIVPSDAECRLIRDFLQAPAQELEDLSGHIQHLQGVLAQLTHRRDGLAQFVEAHVQLATCTIQKLPYEILEEIFIMALPENGYPSMKRADAPLLLSRVCSEWRTLALSMPHLWSSLHITAPSDNMWVGLERVAWGLKTWLGRSRGRPLSLSFHSLDAWTEYTTFKEGTLLLATLTEYSHQWRDVRFVVPDNRSLLPLESLRPDDVPLLQTVSIQAKGVDLSHPFLRFIGGAGLRRVSVNKYQGGTVFWESMQQPGFSWAQLTHLSLPTLGLLVDRAMDIIQQCSKLQNLTLELIGPPSDVLISADEPIYVEDMRQLCLIAHSSYATEQFLEHTFFPNLSSIEYEAAAAIDLSALKAPEKLLHLGFSTSASISSDLFRECLARFPALEDLCLHQSRWSVRHNSAMQTRALELLVNAVSICPRLRSISSYGVDIGSDGDLLALLDARSGLSRVVAAFAREREDVILPPPGVVLDLRYNKAEKPYTCRQANGGHLEDDWSPLSCQWAVEYAD